MKKIYIIGNFLYIENTDGTFKKHPKSGVTATKSSLTGTTYVFLFNGQIEETIAFSDIRDENNVAYGSQAIFDTFVDTNLGFNPASGGSGAGFAKTFSGALKTDAEAARDAFYTANPNELRDGLQVAVIATTPNPNQVTIQIYSEGLSAWEDITTVLSANEIATLLGTIGWEQFDSTEQTKLAGIENAATADQTGAEIVTAIGGVTDANLLDNNQLTVVQNLNSVSDNTVPLKNGLNGFEDSAITETATQVISSKNIQAPPGSLFLGSGVRLSSGLNTVVFRRAGGTQRSIISMIGFDNTGSDDPVFYDLAAQTDFILTDVFDTQLTSGTTPITLSFPVSVADNMATGFKFRPAEAGNLIVKAYTGADTTGDLVIDDVFTVNAGDVGTEITMDVPSPLLTFVGDQVTITIEGIDVFGGVQTTTAYNGVTTPFVNLIGHTFTSVDYITDNNLATKVAALVGPVNPSVHQLSLVNVPARVDLNTTIDGNQVIEFSITNHADIASITLQADPVTPNTFIDVATVTNPTIDGLQRQTVVVSGVTTNTAKTISFRMRAVDNQGSVHTSNEYDVEVRNLSTNEFAYYGARLTNDFATVDLSQLTSVDVTQSGTQFTINQSVPNGQIFGLLTPDNRDPVSIRDSLGSESIDDFPQTANVRTEDGRVYNLRTNTNNSGFTGNYNFTITTE